MMTTLAERIIKRKSAEFAHWSETFNSFMDMSYNTESYEEDNQIVIWTDTELMYAEMLDTMIEISGIREDWDGPHFMPLAVKGGMEVYYQAEKIESLYRFGTDEIGFFLYTDLFYAENIRKMNDDFWFRMSELSQLGTLDLFQSLVFPASEVRQEPFLHYKSKSKIYSLIRNSIALEKYLGTSEEIGSLIVRWNYDIHWNELLSKGSQALRNLYKINYELWRKRKK